MLFIRVRNFCFLILVIRLSVWGFCNGRVVSCPFTGISLVDITIEPYGIIYAEYGESLELPCCQRFRAYAENSWILRNRFFLDTKKQVETYDSRFWNNSEHWLINKVDNNVSKAYYCKHGPSVDADNNTYVFFLNVLNPDKKIEQGDRKDFHIYTKNYLNEIDAYLRHSNELPLRKFQGKNGIRLKAGMRWDEWSKCDACGTERQTRYGRCQLSPTIHNEGKCREGCRMFNKTAFVDCTMYWTVEELNPGLVNFVKSIPDFIVSVKCMGPCDSIPVRSYKRLRTRILKVGDSATLSCPTTNITKPCFWRHDGIRIQADTYDRSQKVAVNEFCVLYIRDASQAEKGNYSCYLDGNWTVSYTVVVNDLYEEASAKWWRHIVYLLYVIFLCFIILIGGIFVGAFQLNNFIKLNKAEVIKEFETLRFEYEKLLPK